MAIFRYTFIKYLKAPSTWVILLISMFIAGFLGGYLPMSALDNKKGTVTQDYAMLILAIGGGITTFLAIFMSVFAGFKGAAMFRDEVEDGTFLVMLSKPQSRRKIIFEKWLALQLLMISYSFLSILSFVVFVEIFDKGASIPNLISLGIGTLKDNIFKMAGFIWAVLIVIGLIFSSIAILLSTKLSAGATVGISIGLGVVIPITGMISMFTAKQEYVSIKSPTFSRMGMMLDNTALSSDADIDKLLFSITKQHLPSGLTSPANKQLMDLLKDFLRKTVKDLDVSYDAINQPDSIYNVALSTGEKDTFKYAWPIDLNYQLRQMSTVVTNNMIPSALKPQIREMKGGGMAGVTMEQKVTGHPKVSDKDQAMTWVKDQVKAIVENQIKWGAAAKELLEKIIDVVGVKTTKGADVSSDLVAYVILSRMQFPRDWVIDPVIVDFLSKPLVQTALHLTFNALYHPLENVFNVKNISKSLPSSFLDAFSQGTKDTHKGAGPLYKKATEYDEIYKTAVLQYTQDERAFGGEKVASLAGKPGHKVSTKTYKLVGGKLVEDKGSTIKFPYSEDTYWYENVDQGTKIYEALLYKANQNPSSFVFMESTDYMPGMTLLYIYLGIALFLVPLSYMIVRRQDFR